MRCGCHKRKRLPDNGRTMVRHSAQQWLRRRGQGPWMLGLLAALLLLAIVFDWNWFRKPLEYAVSHRTQREFRIAHLDVDLGLTPVVKLKDVYYANAPWSQSTEPVARIASLEFSVSLRDLWERRIFVPRAAMSQADLLFERAVDRRKNWSLKPPERSAEPGLLRIGSISLDQGRLRYIDHGRELRLDITAHTDLPEMRVTEASMPARNTAYAMRHAFTGSYRGADFQGQARTGEVLSFLESDTVFPIQGSVRSGSVRLDVEGRVANMRRPTLLEGDVQVVGRSLADLGPFLGLRMPASGDFSVRGRLAKHGERYDLAGLDGKLGGSDVAGQASYRRQQPRPVLSATLHSRQLDLADLAALQFRPTARGRQAGAGAGARPGLSGGSLRAADVDLAYTADRVRMSARVPALAPLKLGLQLQDGLATLAPVEAGVAGGSIVARASIDGRRDGALQAALEADFRRVQLARLLPAGMRAAGASGDLGGQLRLEGTGATLNDALAASYGSATAAWVNGRVSNLLDAGAGLNGGKALALMLGGDRELAVRCGAMAFDIQDGIGRSRLLLVDTGQTRIDGSGSFNLQSQQMFLTLVPVPKQAGILSLRTPVHLSGSLWHPSVALDKRRMAVRGGAAVALALVNPLAALLPLVETGEGKDADCGKAYAQVAGAKQLALATGSALADAGERGGAVK